MSIKEKIDNNPKMKEFVIKIISSTKHPRPRFFTRWLINPFFHKRGKGSEIHRRGSRIDVFPWHRFELGRGSIIENQCIINNGAGDIILGDDVLIGIGCIVTGPVTIGNHSGLGQHVFVSGFNHGFKEINVLCREQPLDKRMVTIGEDTHIGANCTIVAGSHIGNKCQIGAGSVVTKDIPDYSVAVGNPARVIKQYDFDSQSFISVK
jgi:acetyltransferase-like isoleucine patch superfamily enzyme